MVVLLPKGNGEYRGVRLIEVLWKIISGLNNHIIGVVVSYHDTLNGVGVGIGTSTDSFESNMLQRLTKMREEVLYEVFLDLKKAYEALYW